MWRHREAAGPAVGPDPRPMLPFTVRVVINNVSYVPIQMTAGEWKIGGPSMSTRLDLALGLDSDGDGLADEWEQSLIDGDATGRLASLDDVAPDDDLDGDGLTNLEECIAGTCAFDGRSGFDVELIDKVGGVAHFRFLAVRRRTYHFSSSSDGVTWKLNPFSFDPTGSGAKPHFLSDDVGMVDAYLPLENPSHTLFKLHVE